jgi:elongation factor Ts
MEDSEGRPEYRFYVRCVLDRSIYRIQVVTVVRSRPNERRSYNTSVGWCLVVGIGAHITHHALIVTHVVAKERFCSIFGLVNRSIDIYIYIVIYPSYLSICCTYRIYIYKYHHYHCVTMLFSGRFIQLFRPQLLAPRSHCYVARSSSPRPSWLWITTATTTRPIITSNSCCYSSMIPDTVTHSPSSSPPLSSPPRSSSTGGSSTGTSIPLDVLKELRQRTGAPMVDCKKAIEQTMSSPQQPVNLQPALDWLRSHSATKVATKVAGRATTQGLVGIQIYHPPPDSHDSHTNHHPELQSAAAMVQVAAETDFAALSSTFVQLVSQVVRTTLQQSPEKGVEIDPIMLLQMPVVTAAADLSSNSCNSTSSDAEVTTTTTPTTVTTIQNLLDDAIISIRENISITHAIRLPSYQKKNDHDDSHGTGDSIFVGYVHNRVADHTNTTPDDDVHDNEDVVMMGTAAAIVQLQVLAISSSSSANTTATPTREQIQEIGKQLAMHIVAAKPMYLSISNVPLDIVQQERQIYQNQYTESILQQQLATTNTPKEKPPHIVQQILQGKLQKYYDTVCLLEQSHMIVPGNPKIRTYLQEHQLRLQHYEYLSV